MLRRVFRRLPDFEIVATLHDLQGLQPLLLSTKADWLVISAMPDEGVSKQVRALHARYPAMRILVIAADGSEVLINWAEPHEAHMERASLPELISMMRSQDQNVAT
jgi:DNA-binding NarL/FixJ family response regulator